MKFILKLIFIPILVIVAIVGFFLVMFYKSVDVPASDFLVDDETTDLVGMVSKGLDDFLLDNDVEDLEIGFTGKDFNQVLKSSVLNSIASSNGNEAYVGGETEEDVAYVFENEYLTFQGIWVKFSEDLIEIEGGIHGKLMGFTYKTRVYLSFKLSLETDSKEIIFTLDKLKVGKMGLTSLTGVADWIVQMIANKSIDDFVNDNESLKSFLKLNIKEKKLTISLDHLINLASTGEGGAQGEVLNALVEFIIDNEMISLVTKDDLFAVSLALGKLRDNTTPLEISDPLDEAGITNLFETRINGLIISLLDPEDSPFIEINQDDLNRIVEYQYRNMATEESTYAEGVIMEQALFNDYILEVKLPYVVMSDGKMEVNIPVKIYGSSNPLKEFRTIMKINTTPEMSGQDLRLVFGGVTAGELDIDASKIETILALIGETEFIEGNAFVIKNFDEQINQAGIIISNITVSNGRLRMHVNVDETIGNAIDNAVIEALEGVISTYPEEGALVDSINDLIETAQAADPSVAAIAEGISNVVDQMSKLDLADQQAILESMIATLGDNGYLITSIFEFMS